MEEMVTQVPALNDEGVIVRADALQLVVLPTSPLMVLAPLQ